MAVLHYSSTSGYSFAGWPTVGWLIAVLLIWSPLGVSIPSVWLDRWHDSVDDQLHDLGYTRFRAALAHWPTLLTSPAGFPAAASLVGFVVAVWLSAGHFALPTAWM